jgi:hypothetical protein
MVPQNVEQPNVKFHTQFFSQSKISSCILKPHACNGWYSLFCGAVSYAHKMFMKLTSGYYTWRETD